MEHWREASGRSVLQCVEFALACSCLVPKLIAQELITDADKASQCTKIDAFSSFAFADILAKPDYTQRTS
jgi:hypothetical protein